MFVQANWLRKMAYKFKRLAGKPKLHHEQEYGQAKERTIRPTTAKGKQQHVEDSWSEKHDAWDKRQANDFCHINDVFLWHEAVVYLKGQQNFSKEKISKAMHQ